MGLDNGIQIKRTSETNKITELKVFNQNYDKELKCDFEVAYWRKCWGLRNDILWLIGKRWSDEWKFNLNKDDVNLIIKLLESYNADNWEDSIWEWDDEEFPYSEKIKQDIKNLKLLLRLMDEYELEVYFYDSY